MTGEVSSKPSAIDQRHLPSNNLSSIIASHFVCTNISCPPHLLSFFRLDSGITVTTRQACLNHDTPGQCLEPAAVFFQCDDLTNSRQSFNFHDHPPRQSSPSSWFTAHRRIPFPLQSLCLSHFSADCIWNDLEPFQQGIQIHGRRYFVHDARDCIFKTAIVRKDPLLISNHQKYQVHSCTLIKHSTEPLAV